jgi:dTDP-4-dehydrorhamnose reductase
LRILLTGRTGQVGAELEQTLPTLGEVIATDRSALDLASADQIRRAVREAKPDVIVNAAAYTAVDKAESEPELAMRINGEAPGILAEEAKQLDALLLHFSTDYVFDGTKATPYVERDLPNPLNTYGRSKLAGEGAVVASGCRHLILRTGWVYSMRGQNFLMTILRLARERPALRVVSDQVGSPTAARDLAAGCSQLLRRPLEPGIFHMTAAGTTSWHGFAEAIVRNAQLRTPVTPIGSHEYATVARRPRNSVLNCAKLKAAYGIELPLWSRTLAEMMADGMR